jgi:UDP-N-acetylmuramate--alanine ligase
MQEIDLSKINKVHFIGIGGIGISALAKMMLNQGFDISGINDCESSNTLSELFDKSVDIKISTDFKDVKKDADLYIYSLAWDDLTPDLMKETRNHSTNRKCNGKRNCARRKPSHSLRKN